MKLKSPKQLVKHARPREKLAELGPKALTTPELLQVLIGSGNKHYNVATIAKGIDNAITRGAGLNVKNLSQLPGLGLASTTRILAAAELGRRLTNQTHQKYLSPQDIIPLMTEFLSSNKEHLVILTINGAHELIAKHLVTVGILDTALIHPREVFYPAINDQAAGIFMAHNHPSGDLNPSGEDVAVTRIIQQAGKILGIRLLDHLIVNRHGKYYSFLEQGNITL